MFRKLFPNIAAMWDDMDAEERMMTPVIFIFCFALGVAMIEMVMLAVIHRQ